MPIASLLAIITLFLSFSPAVAEMYRWTAEDGSVTFKDTPPTPSKKSRKITVYSDSGFVPAPAVVPTPAAGTIMNTAGDASQPAAPKKERFSGTVEIYVTSWCGYCRQAQSYMKSRGIPFIAYDIEKDQAAKQRHRQLGGRGVPLIIIGSHRMSGFSEEAFEYYLNNSR